MDVISDSYSPWWKISDFNNGVGDIKTLWEVSRFDWLLKMGRLVAQGDVTKLENMNQWISDWTLNNPPYYGPNWKCAQEASIRLINIALAWPGGMSLVISEPLITMTSVFFAK